MKLLLGTIVGILATVATLCTGPARAEEETRLALLIGNSRYEHATPLRNPENDVDLMETSLRTAGFRRTVAKNASLSEANRLLDAFLAEARATPNPVLLVYFAGRTATAADRHPREPRGCSPAAGLLGVRSHAGLAQLVEQPPCKRQVGGSTPSAGTISPSEVAPRSPVSASNCV